MSVPYAKRLKYLDAERMRLRKLLAEQVVENGVIKYALRKNGDRTGAPARRLLVLGVAWRSRSGAATHGVVLPVDGVLSRACSWRGSKSWGGGGLMHEGSELPRPPS